MQPLLMISGGIVAAFIGLLGAALIWKVFTDKIDLTHLISDENGEASLSRFQFLIFTFVIAMSLFLLVVASMSPECEKCVPKFPDIPGGVWGLLGISGGSYLISKGINKKKSNGEPGASDKGGSDQTETVKPKEPPAGGQVPA